MYFFQQNVFISLRRDQNVFLPTKCIYSHMVRSKCILGYTTFVFVNQIFFTLFKHFMSDFAYFLFYYFTKICIFFLKYKLIKCNHQVILAETLSPTFVGFTFQVCIFMTIVMSMSIMSTISDDHVLNLKLVMAGQCLEDIFGIILSSGFSDQQIMRPGC